MRKIFTLLLLVFLATPPLLHAADSGFKQDSIYKRVYQNLALQNVDSTNPSSDYDINDTDGSITGFLRMLFYAQEFTTDEGYYIWTTDYGLDQLDANKLYTNNPELYGLYLRLYKGIDLCNTFLENTSTPTDSKTVQQRAEVRAMRALYFSYAMDLFGNPPLTTSTTEVGKQVGRSALFDFIVNELKNVESSVPAAKAYTSSDANYGHVNQGVVWMLLARLYLNAGVYTGTPHWADAATYAKKVIDSGAYQLYTTATNGWSAYQQLFMGDNGGTKATQEMILPIYLQSKAVESWGASFLVAGPCQSDLIINPDKTTKGPGLSNGAWECVTAREPLVKRFFPDGKVPNVHACEMPTKAGDDRAIIEHSNGGYNYESDSQNAPYMVKYINFKTDGSAGSDKNFIDTDIPLMRYAEALMTYAEAEFRLGNTQEALKYVNEIRTRANAKTLTSLTLNDLYDEWSREFFYESRRRTDMIRFAKFAKAEFRNVFPIPEKVQEEQNLVQNAGYLAPTSKVAFHTPSFLNETITLDSITALRFSWTSVGTGAYDYVVKIDGSPNKSIELKKTTDTTLTVSARDLQRAIWSKYTYSPAPKQIDQKVYVSALYNGKVASTDSLTLHLVRSSKINKHVWFIAGKGIGDSKNDTSVKGVGSSSYPIIGTTELYSDKRQNYMYFEQGDTFKLVVPGHKDLQIRSLDGGISNYYYNTYPWSHGMIYPCFTISTAGWYKIGKLNEDTMTIAQVDDEVKGKVFKSIKLTAGSQVYELKPMSNRTHETVYFRQVAIDKKTRVDIDADTVALAHGVELEPGTYDVFVNKQSLLYQILKSDLSVNDGEVDDSSKPWGKIVSSYDLIPATSLGQITTTDNVDSVQVVQIGTLNSGDEVNNVVMVVNNKEIPLSDDGKAAVKDLQSINTTAKLYADYTEKDVATRRWSVPFTLDIKKGYDAYIEDAQGTRHGLAYNDNNVLTGYAYLKGNVTVSANDSTWTQSDIAEGFYQAQIVKNSASRDTLQLVKIKTIGMMGDFNSWDKDAALTYQKDDNCWEGTLTISSPSYVMFRGNQNWELRWKSNDAEGKEIGYVSTDDYNIHLTTAGTYSVKLYLTYPGDSHYAFTIGTGIKPITDEGSSKPALIYDVNGTRQPALKRGINIIRMSNGKVMKIIVR